MIDALIGAVIAVVATSALAMLAEVTIGVEMSEKQSLSAYEKSVFSVVKSAHAKSAASEDELLSWMKTSASRSEEF